MSLDRVIAVAEGELGVSESPPGSNRVKYWDIFGSGWQGQPWCVAFLAWVYRQAGEAAAFFGGALTASCGTLLRWYREQGLTVDKQNIDKGDIMIANFSGTMEPQHCGQVTHVERSGGSILYIKTIEGNTTSGETSQDNGGMVCEKVRYPRQIVAVCRPQYKAEEPSVDDWSNHHAAAAIRWGKEMGLIQGYPDGTMRPDELLPLWRMLTILKRYHDLEVDLK